jgi:hypothetical protein
LTPRSATDTMTTVIPLPLTVQEWHTVLAALRRWQNLIEAGEDLRPEFSIAQIGGTVPLTPDQIETLVGRIVDDLPPQSVRS